MKLLLVRNDHMGDLVLCLPVADALRKAGHTILLLVAENLAELPGLATVADRILFRKKNESRGKFADRINMENPDILLSFPATRENARLSRRLKIPVKVGHLSKPYNWFSFNRFVTVRRSHPPIHETAFMLAFCRRAGLPDRIDPDFLLRPETMSGLDILEKNIPPDSQGFVTLHPGSRGSAENLDFDTWLSLARKIAEKETHRSVLFILGPDESDLYLRTQTALADLDKVCILPELSLSELCGVLSLADLTVSASTGPMHLAAALGTPTYSFFSGRRAQSPEKWRPLGNQAVIAPLPRNERELDAAADQITATLRIPEFPYNWRNYLKNEDFAAGFRIIKEGDPA